MWLNIIGLLNNTLFVGISLLQHLRFYSYPSPVTTSMLYEDSIFLNSVWHWVYKICDFILVTQLATIICVEGVFMPRKLKKMECNNAGYTQFPLPRNARA
jgi:hypothetical protein